MSKRNYAGFMVSEIRKLEMELERAAEDAKYARRMLQDARRQSDPEAIAEWSYEVELCKVAVADAEFALQCAKDAK